MSHHTAVIRNMLGSDFCCIIIITFCGFCLSYECVDAYGFFVFLHHHKEFFASFLHYPTLYQIHINIEFL